MSRPLRPGLVAEGESDCAFLMPVIDRQLADILELNPAADFDVFDTARSECVKKHGKERFHEAAARLARRCDVVFVHADHHEAHEADWMAGQIGTGRDHVVVLVPRRETEAWVMADPGAFRRFPGAQTGLLPTAVEKEQNPKGVLRKVMKPAGVDDPTDHFEQLGKNISLDALKTVPAYRQWCDRTTEALKGLGYL